MAFALHHTLRGKNRDIYQVRFTHDNSSLLVGTSNGEVVVYDWKLSKERRTFTPWLSTKDQSPRGGGAEKAGPAVMAMKCPKDRPHALVACSNGHVSQWNVNTAACVSKIQEQTEIYAADYDITGTAFATAGTDRCIRLYDANHKFITQIGDKIDHHGNRVASLRFASLDPSLLVSAGWDANVKIWDTRTGEKVRSIVGPRVTGDGLDISGKTILTGSNRFDNQIETWDLISGHKIGDVKWPSADDQCQVYASAFSPSGQYVVAGGAFCSDVLVFNMDTGMDLGGIHNIKKTILCAAFGQNDNTAAVGGMDGNVYILQYDVKKKPVADTNASPKRAKPGAAVAQPKKSAAKK